MGEKPDKKIAVILFNLGGPDSRESIKPFLFNFFMDKNIIGAPLWARFFLAKFISNKRSKCEAGDSYAFLGNKSPLLENSQAQADALDAVLNNQDKGKDNVEYKVFVSMRYWHPMAPEIAEKVKAFNPDEIIRLPLYPQFSTTTTRSSFQTWDKACRNIGLDKPTTSICCYPWQDGFIRANADNVRRVYQQAQNQTGKKPRVLFSAHGLPEKIIKGGDPYQWQCEKSAEAIAKATGIDDLDWQICYQSRVGPLKWIGPSTEEALATAAADNVAVVILPHAFTQEHVETLVEIEIEYRELAEEMGVHEFYRVPTVDVASDFIAGLADMVFTHQGRGEILSHTTKAICPDQFGDCCMRTQS